MTFVIQMRGREWPESMGWQDTTFVPDGCTPAEWVDKMNDCDPQIEYRVGSVVDGRMMLGLDQRDVKNVILALEDRYFCLRAVIEEREVVGWPVGDREKDSRAILAIIRRIDALSKGDGE